MFSDQGLCLIINITITTVRQKTWLHGHETRDMLGLEVLRAMNIFSLFNSVKGRLLISYITILNCIGS